VVDAFLEAVRPVMAASAAGAGCAVAAVTVGAEPPLRNLAATAFDGWTDALAERLAATGVPAAEAADQAALLLALLEGAQVFCRAAGNLEPFDRAARAVRGLA
jgi:hypothetical protein